MWINPVFEKEIKYSILFTNSIFIIFAILVSLSGLYLPDNLYGIIRPVQIPLILAFTLCAIWKKKERAFVAYIILIAFLSGFMLPKFLNIWYSFGQNELMSYAEYARENNLPLGAYNLWERFSLQYYYGGDIEYFQKEIEKSEPIYNDLHGTAKLESMREMFKNPELRSAFCVTDDTKSALDIFHLEEEPTKRLMDFCEKYHVSLACLLLMGLRTYYQKMNGFEDVSLTTTIARRATLKEKKSGGTRIHSFPFRTIFPEDMKFIDGVYAIRDKQNEYFRHANYDPTAYFAYRAKTYPQPSPGLGYEPISLTYQPLTLKEKGLDQLGDIRYKTKWYPNGICPQGMYLTVMHRPEDNGLDFNFEHQIKAVSREELEYLYYYLCKIMFKGAENPDLTIGEIIKLV